MISLDCRDSQHTACTGCACECDCPPFDDTEGMTFGVRLVGVAAGAGVALILGGVVFLVVHVVQAVHG